MLNQIDLSRTDLNLLVLFETVLEEGHVGRAAARLSLSPSAVSHGLGRLRRLFDDPLFLKHPKGVTPTARAADLAAPVADILSRVRGVMSSAEPFDASRVRRRFRIGAPDGASTVILPALISTLEREAPGVDLSVRSHMPQTALADLDGGQVDLMVQPLLGVASRFVAAPLFDEEFVIATRVRHPLGKRPSLKRYAEGAHVVVSPAGDPGGIVDVELRAYGLKRRVAVTVPDHLCALATVAHSDLIAAAPRRLTQIYGPRLGVEWRKLPIPIARVPIQVITTRAAMADAGVAWLFNTIAETCAA
jgi:DNA-binding transcriptional LysR family regulator